MAQKIKARMHFFLPKKSDAVCPTSELTDMMKSISAATVSEDSPAWNKYYTFPMLVRSTLCLIICTFIKLRGHHSIHQWPF